MLSIICQKSWASIWAGIFSPLFNNFLREDVCGFQVLHCTSFSKASPAVEKMPFPLYFVISSMHSSIFQSICHESWQLLPSFWWLTSLSPHTFSKKDNVISNRAKIGSYRVKKKLLIFLCRSSHMGHKQIYGISMGLMFLEGGMVIRKKLSPKTSWVGMSCNQKEAEKHCLVLMCILCKIMLLQCN